MIGIQAASGSLCRSEDDAEPVCAICHRGIGEFACRECNALVCFDHAHHYRGADGRTEVYCDKHIPDAEETAA